MKNFTTKNFTATTAEDQENYFFAEFHPLKEVLSAESGFLPPGNYRVVDGNLCRIVSGLSQEEVRSRLRSFS